MTNILAGNNAAADESSKESWVSIVAIPTRIEAEVVAHGPHIQWRKVLFPGLPLLTHVKGSVTLDPTNELSCWQGVAIRSDGCICQAFCRRDFWMRHRKRGSLYSLSARFSVPC
jgi:hypothetical protein